MENIKTAPTFKRIVALIIDAIFLLISYSVFSLLVMEPIFANIPSIAETSEQYSSTYEKYEDILKEYGILVSDSSGNYVTTSVDSDVLESISKDPNYTSIVEDLSVLQSKMLTYINIKTVVSFSCASLIFLFIVPMLSKTRQTIGQRCMNLVLYKNDQIITRKTFSLRYLFVHLILILPSPLIYFVPIIITCLTSLIRKDGRTFQDMLFNTDTFEVIVSPEGVERK